MLRSDTLDLGQRHFEFSLEWVWVSVIVGHAVRILVGIEKDVSLLARVFVAGRAIRCEFPNIWSYQLFKLFHALSDFILTVIALR